MKVIRIAIEATGKVHSPEAGEGFSSWTPMDMGIESNVVVKVKAYRYSPQIGTKVRIATVTRDGVTSGIIICQYRRIGEQPSATAASSKSLGMEVKALRIIYMLSDKNQPV